MPRHDDTEIADHVVLIRAVQPDWIREENGTERLTSATFADGEQEASCFIAEEVGGLDGFRENILPRLSELLGFEIKDLATISMATVREAGLWVYRKPEEFDGNAAHVVICPPGEWTKSQYKKRAASLAPQATRISLDSDGGPSAD
jgi:hypothetical protein